MGISTHSAKTSVLHECTDDINGRVNRSRDNYQLSYQLFPWTTTQPSGGCCRKYINIWKTSVFRRCQTAQKEAKPYWCSITNAEHDGSSANTETTCPQTIQCVVIPDDHENIEQSETNGFIGVERTRIRTKRFFFSGIAENVSAELISAYLSKRNINPTLLRVFPSRRKGTNSAKIYVRTSDVGTLPKDNFWPKCVVCKPWLSKEKLKINQVKNAE